jgi:hypothetical protein
MLRKDVILESGAIVAGKCGIGQLISECPTDNGARYDITPSSYYLI